ncbi:hypothetical protein OXX80_004166 [Metschnikowia pulcherrima]
MQVTKESQRSENTRATILFYLSAFVAFLGVPLFFYTTSIHRAHLPTEEVQQRVTDFGKNAVFHIPIYVDFGVASPELISQTQRAIDASLAQENSAQAWGLDLRAGNAEKIDKLKDYVVTLKSVAAESDSSLMYRLSPTSKEICVYTSNGHSIESMANYLSMVLLQTVFKDELAAVKKILNDEHTTDVVFPYAPAYNVVFNLFVEDGRPVTWPIEQAVEFIQPVFSALKNYANFKISSQIHYYSKLQSEPSLNDDGTARVIPQTDLATFINYGEWNLNTHDIAPSINFLVFFPSGNYENVPLLVENSRTNSFLIPQWGGVHIFNTKETPKNDKGSKSVYRISESELEPVFDIFASQLFELLGVPKAPMSPFLRVDAFHRVATLKNMKRALSNLQALLKISSSLHGISIPESTRANVISSLENYDKAVESLQNNDFEASVAFAAKSVTKSDEAFFEKEMVQQAYFPSEHKLAVFSPLLGPICSIVFFGLIKYLRSRKASRKESETSEPGKKEI